MRTAPVAAAHVGANRLPCAEHRLRELAEPAEVRSIFIILIKIVRGALLGLSFALKIHIRFTDRLDELVRAARQCIYIVESLVLNADSFGAEHVPSRDHHCAEKFNSHI